MGLGLGRVQLVGVILGNRARVLLGAAKSIGAKPRP